jgi:peptidoglycan/LPS O-acetylase OafA/YrhL
MTLSDAIGGDRNTNLVALRLGLAAFVIVSHAWPIALGPGTTEPLMVHTGHSLGGWAVGLFFFLSGLLVTASAERRTALSFLGARARRILPGLGVALIATLALAYLCGATPNRNEAISWFVRAATLASIEHRISGAFAGNPYAEVVNGPLWSLFHEVAAYSLCFLFVQFGLHRRKPALLFLTLVPLGLSLVEPSLPDRLGTFAPLFACFAAGMAAHVFKDRIALNSLVAIGLLPVVVVAPWPVGVPVVAYGLLSLSLSVPALRLPGDYSYGFYIYGWPVAQTIAHLVPGISPAELAALSLAATTPAAVVSWHLVELPSLSQARALV